MPDKKIKPQVNIRDTYYQQYRKDDPNPNVDVKIYMKIVLGYIKFLMALVLAGRHVRLPDRMGVIGIRGRRKVPFLNNEGAVRNLSIDWKSTNELWASNEEAARTKKFVFFFNEHTNGIRYKLKWYKRDVNIENKYMYYLRLSRTNRRTIANLIKNNQEYLTEN